MGNGRGKSGFNPRGEILCTVQRISGRLDTLFFLTFGSFSLHARGLRRLHVGASFSGSQICMRDRDSRMLSSIRHILAHSFCLVSN